MNKKYIDIALIVIGVVLVIWGYDVYDSAGSQVTRALSGDTPVEAWIGMIGGAVCIAIGVLRVK